MESKFQKITDLSIKSKINGNIIFWDSLPGSGKTTLLINSIIDHLTKFPTSKFIIIVTLKSEITRMADALAEFEFASPEILDKVKTKRDSFLKLLKSKKNIVTTHRLMDQYDKSFDKYLKNYYVIIDEEINCAKPIKVKRASIKRLILSNELVIDENNKVTWNEHKELPDITYANEYVDIVKLYELINNGNVYCHTKDDNITFFIWLLPKSFLCAPHKVYILSYMLKSSILMSYIISKNIHFTFEKLYELKERENEIIEIIKNKLNIVEDINFIKPIKRTTKIYKKLSERLQTKYILSTNNLTNEKSYFTDNERKILKTSIYCWCQKNFKFSEDIIFTCPKDLYCLRKCKIPGIYYGHVGLKPSGIHNNFVASTTRATNDYSNRHIIIFIKNIFMNPAIKLYFNTTNDNKLLNDDDYALSELIQLIFRSAIRKDEEIYVIIPSGRMRNLLKNWINAL